MAIALERYLGICHSQSDFLIRRSRYYICAIAVVCLLIDMPRFFEISPVVSNATAVTVDFKYSDLRKDPVYIEVYTLWIRLVFTAVVPFVLMLVFNVKILLYYKKNRYEVLATQHYLGTISTTTFG